MKLFVFEFLTRPGCRLCDEARPLVLAEVEKAHGVVLEVDIDSEDRLVSLYGMRIPVLLASNGEVVAEGVIDAHSLRRSLRIHGRKKNGS